MEGGRSGASPPRASLARPAEATSGAALCVRTLAAGPLQNVKGSSDSHGLAEPANHDDD